MIRAERSRGGKELNLLKIFICGDSTAASYNPEETLLVGWGQLLDRYLPASCEVVNLAMAGRSTKTFLQENRLEPMMRQAAAGDLALIQFAHNDENEKKPERYVPLPAFEENLTVFICRAREVQAVPVLLTPICMRVWEQGILQPTHGNYPRAAARVAKAQGVPLIDLYTESFRLVSALGEEGSKALFLHLAPGQDARCPEGAQDNAHTREAGADRFAAFAARELIARGLVS